MTETNYNELKIIGSTELDQTWKNTVRERQKAQDNNVWEEFSKNENSIVNTVSEGAYAHYDPYQYLKIVPLAEHYIEKMEERQNSSETADETVIIAENDLDMQYASGDRMVSSSIYNEDEDDYIPFIEEPIEDENATGVNVAEELDHPNTGDTVHQTPAITVRHDQSTITEIVEHPEGKHIMFEPTNEYYLSNYKLNDETESQSTNKNVKCNENVDSKRQTNTFQPSMYFEKVKTWRVKINEILFCIIELFQNETCDDYDHADLIKLQKRANEFSGRFTRIYVYQLQKQHNDLRRHMLVSLPFGKRTQFQAQSTRVLSLHQNAHQALQMLHHPLDTCLWLGEGGQPLQALLEFLRDATETCRELAPSPDLKPMLHKLYDDEILPSCMKLELLVKRHLRSIQILMESLKYGSPSSYMKKSAYKEREMKQTHTAYGQKPTFFKREKYSPKYEAAAARLSMYNLENLKPNMNSKFSYNDKMKLRLDQGTDKPGSSLSQTNIIKQKRNQADKESQAKEIKQADKVRKSKKCSRKPLMREGRKGSGRGSIRKKVPEEDIETMVESVQSNSPVEKSKSSTPKTPTIPKSIITAAAPEPAAAAAEAPWGRARARGALRSCDVTALLHRLCGTTAEADSERPLQPNRVTRVSGASNAQLVCVKRDSPRRSRRSSPSAAVPATNTPQLLKILEETIQKAHKTDGSMKAQNTGTEDGKSIPDKFLLHFDTPERVVQNANDYRKQFIEYMMSSPMYANTAFNKPWEVVGKLSDKIIEELLLNCALEMQLEKVLLDLYHVELNN